MFEKFKFTKKTMIALAGAVTILGGGIMSVTSLAANPAQTKMNVVMAEESLKLPGAGMGGVIDSYVGATSGSSVELLSTTALASSLGDTYNEYYDASGSTIGKLIIYNGEGTVDVYDKIKGSERVEQGAAAAKVIGHMHPGDVATLVKTQGDWYEIVSDAVHGFVKKDGFARGIEAEGLDGSSYISAAYANSDDVYLYEEDWDGSRVLCVLPSGVRYALLEDGDELSKISVPSVGEGWVYNDQMTFAVVRRYASLVSAENDAANRINNGVASAEGVEEDKARAAEEAAAAEAAQAALSVYSGDVDPATLAGISAGSFVIPLNGQFSSGFGWRWGSFHKGVDYWCGYGEPIWASNGGVVLEAGWSTWGYGNYVLIQHDDHIVTRYAHMSSLNVSAGQTVSQYDVIGFAGETGDAAGVHCHFELLVDGNPVDPLAYVY